MHRLGRWGAVALVGAAFGVMSITTDGAVAQGDGRGDSLTVRPIAARPGIAVGEPPPGRGGGFGLSTFITGLGGATPSNSLLRFVNKSRIAGAVTLTLYDAASGTQLATWTSATIGAGAGVEVSMARIVTAATPALTSTQQASVLNAVATATFRGDSQHLALTGTAVLNQSTCASDRKLGYVEGPGYTGLSGAVRLSNPSDTSGTITAAIYDGSTGTQLGTWTSASVPAHASITVSASSLGAATSPAVPTSTAALTIVPTGATARLRLEHLAGVTGQTTASNLTATCPL